MFETTTDVLVVGAGQAGLAAGYWLTGKRASFVIVDSCDRVGDNWRQRYESLTLFTPRRFSGLPRMALAGDAEGYPTRLEFADYLERYAAMWNLPVAARRRLVALARDPLGFRAAFEDGSVIRSRAVIVATGGFQLPIRPGFSQEMGLSIAQFDARSYRAPRFLPRGPVLVVGDGASGRDIAMDLAATNETWLAVGKPRKLLPERIMGKSIWHWLSTVGLMRARADSWVAKRMRKIDPFPDRNRSLGALKDAGVNIASRLVSAKGGQVAFADGRELRVASVVWCIGYRDDFGWLDVAGAKDSGGRILHDQGVSPVDGLYFVGRPWQRNRASALIMGAGEDAKLIVDRAVRLKRR